MTTNLKATKNQVSSWGPRHGQKRWRLPGQVEKGVCLPSQVGPQKTKDWPLPSMSKWCTDYFKLRSLGNCNFRRAWGPFSSTQQDRQILPGGMSFIHQGWKQPWSLVTGTAESLNNALSSDPDLPQASTFCPPPSLLVTALEFTTVSRDPSVLSFHYGFIVLCLESIKTSCSGHFLDFTLLWRSLNTCKINRTPMRSPCGSALVLTGF